MNISTYEARIKALEDQLNPPGPGGLLSVTVSPDIELSDGTSLNAKMAALMPIEPGGDAVVIRENLPKGTLSAGAVYNVTVTPSPGYYAVINSGSAPEVSDTPGEPLTKAVTAEQASQHVNLNVGAIASETGTPDGSHADLALVLTSF